MLEKMNSFKFEHYDKQKDLEELYAKKFNIDTASYVPLMVHFPSL